MSDQLLPLAAFSGYGIELEYMIVDRNTLSVLPITDELIRSIAGDYVSEIEQGLLAWSNELVLHVIELKTNGPAKALESLPAAFQADITRLNALLEPFGGWLMPTGMHPWMDPHRETRLWSHEYNAIYQAFDRIFGCRGHGWANLQSAHLNLPFANDDEFLRLHAAIRVLLPILPALSASSPILEGRITGLLDTRLETYRHNTRKIPSITGRVIPEPVSNREEYHTLILAPMYDDIAPYDRDGILQHEWLNARGAIARFERNAIEIRVLDIQECPLADLATVAAIVGVLKALVAECWSSVQGQQALGTVQLESILLSTLRDADRAVIHERGFLQLFDFPGARCEVRELWHSLIERVLPNISNNGIWVEPLKVILNHGPLARRILQSVGKECCRPRLVEVYRELCNCLAQGKVFLGID